MVSPQLGPTFLYTCCRPNTPHQERAEDAHHKVSCPPYILCAYVHKPTGACLCKLWAGPLSGASTSGGQICHQPCTHVSYHCYTLLHTYYALQHSCTCTQVHRSTRQHSPITEQYAIAFPPSLAVGLEGSDLNIPQRGGL